MLAIEARASTKLCVCVVCVWCVCGVCYQNFANHQTKHAKKCKEISISSQKLHLREGIRYIHSVAKVANISIRHKYFAIKFKF